jgi:hypothetical protein
MANAARWMAWALTISLALYKSAKDLLSIYKPWIVIYCAYFLDTICWQSRTNLELNVSAVT